MMILPIANINFTKNITPMKKQKISDLLYKANNKQKAINYSNISFGVRINRHEPKAQEKDMLAAIISDSDYEDFANILIKNNAVSSTNYLVDIYKDKDKGTMVHLAVSENTFGDKFSHFYYSINDFKDVIKRVQVNSSNEYPEKSSEYAKYTLNIMRHIRSL